ncbi:bifunctional lysylphosphatidylglycerol synthetase/lysine--tRNA ligase LysX [Rothia halotolerans]|uniref:bifunctional lysylphosphatidylglycerol synthetase/lysine--tRNA ligase LysX n=1 Tax=Rothia halotolerans TaxID=405770 RepID=UPI00101DC126|nr:bifunctional lysylphosphatidylglycerol synthetase/lysine--tRNA ligase LysX [Rothia halotolerans]
MSRSASRRTAAAERGRGERTARLITWLYALALIVNLALLIAKPPRAGYTLVELLFGVVNLPVERSLISVVVSGAIFWALLRRKRVGLFGAMFFQLMGIVIAIALSLVAVLGEEDEDLMASLPLISPIFDYIGAVVAVVMLVLLFRARRAFPAKVGGTSYGAALGVLLLGAGVAVLVAWLMVPAGSASQIGSLLLNAMGITSPSIGAQLPHVRHWQVQVIATVYGLAAIAAILVFLRSGKPTHSWSGEQEVRLRGLLHEYGHQDSLSYFATRRDKSTVFSPDGRAAVSYRVIRSVSLASGDPVGDPASWDAAIDAWKREARTYAWIPAAISAGEAGARAYVRAGMAVIPMGDEAILHPGRFSLNNTSMTELRHTVSRLSRAGMTYRIRRHGELSEAELRELLERSEAWRHGGAERGFSMALNRLGDPADSRCLLLTAHTADGEPVGLLSFVPWGSTGVSLDVMRRAPDSPNGTTEFMIVKLMEEADGLGVSRVSLNFAMFRETFARSQEIGASALTRLNSSVLGVLDRFLQLERLYTFNQKFAPDWVPRFLCVDSRVSTLNVGVSAGIAEGFLPQALARTPSAEGTLTPEELERVREVERHRLAAEDLTPRWSDQTRHRIEHLRQMREAGYEPYPKGTGEGMTVGELARRIEAGAAGASGAESLCVTGRVRAIRRHGGVAFLDLVEHGVVVQAVLEEAACGPETRGRTRWVDTGDHLLLRGRAGASRNGTPSLLVESWELISKCLHPIPFDSFTDPEARLRRRSMDLIVNPEESRRLRIRSATIRSIRRTLDERGFLEVETPMLNVVHGGASARPFKTFINAYGVDLTLRIAPELYLKRLVVGDMGPVYELGRDFRNEGADATHNPEFTVLEAYRPHEDYMGMKRLTERMLKDAAREVFGREVLPLRLGPDPKDPQEPAELVDVSGPWPVVSVCQALSDAVGRPITLGTDIEVLLELARQHEIHVRDDMGPGAIIEELYGELVEARTSRPTFYRDFPVETSPLAGPHRTEPGLAERWDLVINGTEMGTAYSEMADALEQRRRLTEQSLKAAAGDLEAMQVDEDFLDALETGMPPTGGLGIGVDRLIMMLTGAPIRGVLAFPFVRPGTGTRARSAARTAAEQGPAAG